MTGEFTLRIVLVAVVLPAAKVYPDRIKETYRKSVPKRISG